MSPARWPLADGPPMGTWRQQGACFGDHGFLGLAFPEHEPTSVVTKTPRTPAEKSQAEAMRVCLGCPVRQDCLDFALSSNQEFGVWGATTAPERRRMKRVRQTAARYDRAARRSAS